MRRGLLIVLCAVCAVVIVAVTAVVVAVLSSRRDTRENEAKARATAQREARDFAGQVRAAAGRGPLSSEELAALRRTGHAGMVRARRDGGATVVTFSVIESYAVPGGIAPDEVNLCFTERISGTGDATRSTLAPLDCARIPVPLPPSSRQP